MFWLPFLLQIASIPQYLYIQSKAAGEDLEIAFKVTFLKFNTKYMHCCRITAICALKEVSSQSPISALEYSFS